MGLHSHTYYANTRLFKKFIAKFIAESSETESKQKDDFIEDFIEKTVQLESNSKDDFIEEWG